MYDIEERPQYPERPSGPRRPSRLRPYQEDAACACLHTHDDGIVISPTGSGKSHIIQEVLRSLKCSHIVTPRTELVNQFKRRDLNISCSTINKAYIDNLSGDLLIIDECHLVKKFGGMYQKVMSNFKRVIGFTATPFRLDSGHLVPDIFPRVLYEVKREDLIRDSFLLDRQYQPIPEDRLINVRDRNMEVLSKVAEESCQYTDKILDHFIPNIPPNEQALLFTCSIDHAEQVTKRLPDSKVIHSKLPKSEIDEILHGFKNNQFKYLVNCQLLTTGFDYPALKHIVILRPTTSFSLYEQICGRGDRIHPGKSINTVWDYTVNLYHFGALSSSNPHRFCFECGELTDYRKKKCAICGKKLVKGEAPRKACFFCGTKNHTVATYCVKCNQFLKADVFCIKAKVWNVQRHRKRLYFSVGYDLCFHVGKAKLASILNFLNKDEEYLFYYKKKPSTKLIKIVGATTKRTFRSLPDVYNNIKK